MPRELKELTTSNRVNIVTAGIVFNYLIRLIETIGIADSRYISRKTPG